MFGLFFWDKGEEHEENTVTCTDTGFNWLHRFGSGSEVCWSINLSGNYRRVKRACAAVGKSGQTW
jgi:hypothetical protein